MSSEALLVLTTCANASEADGLAEALVEARLAACVNRIDGVRSTYRWQDRIERDAEILLLIKTTEDRFGDVERTLRERSTYELPEVVAVRVAGGSAAYLDWIGAAVQTERQ